MKMNTKLVKCGGHIEVFDYECPVKNKNFIYERKGEVRLPRHIRLNFKASGRLTYAKLILNHTNCQAIRNELEQWFTHFKQPILAVIEPYCSQTIVYVLHNNLDNLLRQNPLQHLIECTIITDKVQQVMQVFIKAFEHAVGDELRKAKQYLIEHNLKQPEILWNKRAEAFIKEHGLINRIPYKTLDLWDRGWYSYNCYQI